MIRLKKYKTHCILLLAFVGTCMFATHSGAKENLLSLENLERERAAMIHDLLDPKLDVLSRKQKLAKRQRQLTDMERMVIRDERLLNSRAVHVKRAFDNYDSTFLVHAGAEQERSASQQWFSNIKLSNEAILTTRVGYRK